MTRPVRVRAQLPGSLQDVFAYVSDPRNDPDWVDTTPKVTQEVGHSPMVGSIYTYEQTVGRKVEGSIEIIEMDEPTFIAFKVEDPLRIYRVEYHLSPSKDGVQLEQVSFPEFKINLGWKAALAPFMIRKQLRKQMRALRAALS